MTEVAARRSESFTGPSYVQVTYWLQLAVSPDYYGYGIFEMRDRLAGLVRGCGIACEPRQVRVTMHRIEPPPRRIPEALQDRLAYGTVELPASTLDYPAACGDWGCPEDHWAWANPASEPAVYAGVAAETRIVNATGWPTLAMEAIQHQRDKQAGGQPLWTIDIRPAPFAGCALEVACERTSRA